MLAERLADPLLGRGLGWFAFEAALTFLVTAAIVAAALRAFCGPTTLRRHRALIALGVGPCGVPLVLNALLVIVPGRSSAFYVISIVAVFAVLALAARRHFGRARDEAAAWLRGLLGWRSARRAADPIALCWASLLSLFLLYASVRGAAGLLELPLVGHDTWEYGAIARNTFQSRAITFVKAPFFPHNGFYSVSKHAPSFPLFHTWERMCDDVLGVDVPIRHSQPAPKDSLFRAVSLYYGVLMLFSLATLLHRKDRGLAAVAPIALFYTPAFQRGMFSYYVDPFRVFLLTLAVVALYEAVRRPSAGAQTLLALLAGMAGYAHSIGAVAAVPILGAFLLTAPLGRSARLVAALRITVVALLAGGWHYVLDVLFGTGWVFRP